MKYKTKIWTDERLNILKQNYNKISKTELMKLLSFTTWKRISDRARKLDLRRYGEWNAPTPEEIKERAFKIREARPEPLPDPEWLEMVI